MKFDIEIGPFWFGVEVSGHRASMSVSRATTPPAPAKDPAKEKAARETEFEQWRARNAATSGQFGFGRRDLTAIEHPANRWEPGGRVR